MFENPMIILLALFTLAAGGGYAAWQWRRAREARRRGETSSFAHGHDRKPRP